MNKTTDGVTLLVGGIVYYVDTTAIGEPVKGCLVSTKLRGTTVDDIIPKALGGRVYSKESMASRFKDYYRYKRTQIYSDKFNSTV